MDHSRLDDSRFSESKTSHGAVPCLNGNLLRAMLKLGYQDERLGSSLEAVAQAIQQDGFRCRYHATKPTPQRMRDGLPCAWGAVKVLGAFGAVPIAERSPAVRAGIEAGVEMIIGHELAAGDFPTATRRSPLWHRFGFPLGFTSDLLEAMLVLGQLGMATDPRLGECIDVLLGKRLESGRWLLEHTPKNTWAILGRIGEPSKWITLRALKVLKEWEETQ
jgi:hypothetical protein